MWLMTAYLFPDAVFGTPVEVPTIDGRAKIKIPPGTQSGKVFRLKGKGFPAVNSYEKGDQLVHVNVWTPQNFNIGRKSDAGKIEPLAQFQTGSGKKPEELF